MGNGVKVGGVVWMRDLRLVDRRKGVYGLGLWRLEEAGGAEVEEVLDLTAGWACCHLLARAGLVLVIGGWSEGRPSWPAVGQGGIGGKAGGGFQLSLSLHPESSAWPENTGPGSGGRYLQAPQQAHRGQIAPTSAGTTAWRSSPGCQT